MKKVVVIGGGSGSFTVLNGLKKYPLEISSIVTMFDSGGSTGKLRSELGVLPPGDLRRCLIALADEEKSKILKELFAYRFQGSADNHSLGNLLITAAEKNYGSMAVGLKKISELLNIQGKVIPVCLEQAHIHARLKDGSIVEEEAKIDVPTQRRAGIEEVYLVPNVWANQEAIDAIEQADLIVIGPGDIYTSITPNLLVGGICEAIQRSNAKIVYVCNAMTKKGETDGYTSRKFVEEIERYVKKRVDHILFSEGKISADILDRYRADQQYPVVFDLFEDRRVIIADLNQNEHQTLIRYDSDKLARELIRLL